ncbi:hypothetical protein FOZ63_004482, partial [Perkinsus olseni]
IEKPTPGEVRDYALWLGLTDDDRDLFWIAVQGWGRSAAHPALVFSAWKNLGARFDSFYQQAVTKYKKGKCTRKELAELLSQPWLLEGLHKHRASSAKPAAGARAYKNGRNERTPADPCPQTTNVDGNNNRAEKEEERLKSVMAWAEHAVTSSSDSETEQRRQKHSSDGEESQRLFTTRDTKMKDSGQVFAELEEMREEMQRVKQKLADVRAMNAGVNEEISQLANAQERVDQSVHDCQVELERTKEDLTRTREETRATSQARETSDAAITMQGTEEEARIESLRTALQQTNDELASSESVVEAYRTEAAELRARLTEARD